MGNLLIQQNHAPLVHLQVHQIMLLYPVSLMKLKGILTSCQLSTFPLNEIANQLTITQYNIPWPDTRNQKFVLDIKVIVRALELHCDNYL